MIKTPIEMADGELNIIINKVIELNKETAVGSNHYCEIIRDKLDRTFGPAWHVIVGKNFGCYAVHDTNKFAHFSYNGFTYLIYKTTI